MVSVKTDSDTTLRDLANTADLDKPITKTPKK